MSGSITALKAGPQCLLDAHDAEIGGPCGLYLASTHGELCRWMPVRRTSAAFATREVRKYEFSAAKHYLHRLLPKDPFNQLPHVSERPGLRCRTMSRRAWCESLQSGCLRGWFRALNLGHRGLPAAGASNCSRPASGRIQLLHGPSSAGPG